MVRLANALLSACSDLIGISTPTQPSGSHRERFRRYVVGERWTEEQRADSQRVLEEVAHARKNLAEHARRKLGKRRVELFGHADPGDVSQSQQPKSETPETPETPGQVP